MQSGYETVKGWLGIIMGDKIFINFTKYEHDECIRRLMHEINSHFKIDPIKTSLDCNFIAKPPETSKIQENTIEIEDWSENLVKEWFIKNRLNLNIFDYLKPDSGSILKQMYQMKNNATEFYYQLMNKIEEVKIHEVLQFSSCLEKLFEKKIFYKI